MDFLFANALSDDNANIVCDSCLAGFGNDVFQDEAGIIYLIDRRRGLHLLERV